MSPQPAPTIKTSQKPPTPIANVTGTKKGPGREKGVATGPRTKPSLALLAESNIDMLGAITNTAREVAAKNDGYCNKDLIYRALAKHPAFQRMIEGPADSAIQPMRAYDLLTPEKVFSAHKEVVDRWVKQFPKGNPYGEFDADTYGDGNAEEYEGGPKKGAFAQLVRARQVLDVSDL